MCHQKVVKLEPLFAVKTEKSTNDKEAPVSGILKKIIAPVDSTVAVTSIVAMIDGNQ